MKGPGLDIFSTIRAMERVLDYHLARHNVLSTNLAHAETPGFKPKDLVFDETLASEQVHRTHGDHLGGDGPRPGSTRLEKLQSQGLEEAMARVSANRLRYEAGVEITRRRISLLKYAASDGAS